jgi:hypothetical protein
VKLGSHTLDNIDKFQGFAIISSSPFPMSRAFLGTSKSRVIKHIFPQTMSKLRQQGGFAYSPQPGNDHGVGQVCDPLDLSQLCPLDPGVALPEHLVLLQQHGFHLIFRPF